MTDVRSGMRRVYDAKHRMPPIGPYLRETISRTVFAYEKSRLDLRAIHKDTWFGRLWSVLNPLMLGLVYWLLVEVIFATGGDGSSLAVLAQILGGLFVFALPSASLSLGALSIVGGGTFVFNTRLPRLILPIGSVISALLMFAPSMAVYAVIHLAAGLPIGTQLLWVPVLIGLLTALSLGLATIIATANVYFRDVASLLPYVARIWMYLTPIIYLYRQFPEDIRWLQHANPLGGIFTSLQQVLIEGGHPRWTYLVSGSLWSLGLLVGGVIFFVWREREFAVRL